MKMEICTNELPCQNYRFSTEVYTPYRPVTPHTILIWENAHHQSTKSISHSQTAYQTFHKSLIKNWLPARYGISHSQTVYQTFHKSLIKNWLPARYGISHSQTVYQTFHKSLIKNRFNLRKSILPTPTRSISYAIFCEKTALTCEKVYYQPPPGGQFLLDFL